MLYVIVCSLNNKAKNYQPLYERLKGLSPDLHEATPNLWFMQTNQGAAQITYAVSECIDRATDKVFVCDITSKTMNGWLYTSSWNWINTHNS